MVEWSNLVGGGAVGVIVYGVIAVLRMIFAKPKLDAEAQNEGISGAGRLSQQTLDAMERLTTFYEARIKAIQLDAENQIASARADAANAAATALREIATARAEFATARADMQAEMASYRRSVEVIETVRRRALEEAWKPDFSIERLRSLLAGGDEGTGGPNGVVLVPR